MKNINFKKGAASFYIVAFSTLILLIIATSFAAIIISELTRTSNDDLAQSAYDSAMAGIEDAKTAFLLYRQCEDEGNDSAVCKRISRFIAESNQGENNNESCYMVGKILGKLSENGAGGEVVIKETREGGNNMSQAYTCVKLKTELTSIDGNLTSSAPLWAVELNQENFPDINEVRAINIYWSKEKDKQAVAAEEKEKGVVFPTLAERVLNQQPIIVFAMAQMGEGSSFDDFEKTAGEQTNRGTVFLIPVKDGQGQGKIGAEKILKSNDKTKENTPQLVTCDEDGCGVTIEIPELVNEYEYDRTSMILAFALPYGGPSTALSFEACKESKDCSDKISSPDGNTASDSLLTFDGVQIEIDSTGKANDLYRRVVTRLNPGAEKLNMMGPLQLSSGNSGKNALEKNLTAICEMNFEVKNCE